MRKKISRSDWEQARTAYAAGIGLRELARKMGIAQGTMLARASREHWKQQVANATRAMRSETPTIVSAPDAAAVTMRERAERHVARMAGITDKVLPHLEEMEPAAILSNARNLERFDYVARRNYGLESLSPNNGVINLAILTNQAAVQVVTNTAS